MKYFPIVMFLIFSNALYGASACINNTIHNAKKLLREGSILSNSSLINKAREMLLAVYPEDSNYYILYFIAQSEYELARLAFAHNQYESFELNYENSIKRLNKLITDKPEWSEPYALLAVLYGYKIAKSNINALTLGPKAYFLALRAIELDKDNPRAWYVMGTIKFHMPEILGGGKEEAISSFKKGIELYEKNTSKDSLSPDWGHIDALLWLGWTYEKLKKPKEAILSYKNALTIFPQARWIGTIFIDPLRKQYDVD